MKLSGNSEETRLGRKLFLAVIGVVRGIELSLSTTV
jgi:hypothetical protein